MYKLNCFKNTTRELCHFYIFFFGRNKENIEKSLPKLDYILHNHAESNWYTPIQWQQRVLRDPIIAPESFYT